MIRDRSIAEIFDGNYYSPGDMVLVGCSDCAGCSECCRNTGDSIILDPWDMYMLTKGTGKTFTDMIEREIEIRLVDGLILPNLMQHHESDETGERSGREDAGADSRDGRTNGDAVSRDSRADAGAVSQDGRTDAPDLLSGDHCPFLSQAGRCSIHPFRPGMCRLYPMGRYYTEGGFRYILQKDECTDREKTSVLLQDWLGIENLARYESYILDWHDFKGQAEESLHILTQKSRESVTRYILQIFFVHPYEVKLDFYAQYDARMEICRQALADILPK